MGRYIEAGFRKDRVEGYGRGAAVIANGVSNRKGRLYLIALRDEASDGGDVFPVLADPLEP
jgi:hypothetical protein